MIYSADVKDSFISLIALIVRAKMLNFLTHFWALGEQNDLGSKRLLWHPSSTRKHYMYVSRSCPKFRGKLSVIVLTDRLVHIRIVCCYACPDNISQSHNFQTTTVIEVFCHVGNVLGTRLVIIRQSPHRCIETAL